jgi:integrase
MAGKKGRAAYGSIRRRESGRWAVRAPGPDGRSRSLGTFRTKDLASAALAADHTAVAGGTWTDPTLGDQTLGEFIKSLQASGRGRVSSNKLNKRLAREWIVAPHAFATEAGTTRVVCLGTRSLGSLGAPDIRDWHAAVSAEARRRAVARKIRAATSVKATNRAIRLWASDQGLTVAATGRLPEAVRAAWEADGGPARLRPEIPHTAGQTEPAQAYRHLHAILAKAVSDGRIAANPAQIAGAGGVEAIERTPATFAEIQIISDGLIPRYQAAPWIAAFTALRSGELFALARRHYDRATRTIKVERDLEPEGSPNRFGPTKTKSSARSQKLGPMIAVILEAHIDRFTAPGKDSLIFTTEGGGPVYPARIGPAFRLVRAEADRDDLTWHDLRHTGASHGAEQGVSLRELQDWLGHTTVSAAMRYMHIVERQGSRIATGIDAALTDANITPPTYVD